MPIGDAVGLLVGEVVRIPVALVGAVVGSSSKVVGAELSISLGDSVGTDVGSFVARVGIGDATMVGCVDGALEGWISFVGEADGTSVFSAADTTGAPVLVELDDSSG